MSGFGHNKHVCRAKSAFKKRLKNLTTLLLALSAFSGLDNLPHGNVLKRSVGGRILRNRAQSASQSYPGGPSPAKTSTRGPDCPREPGEVRSKHLAERFPTSVAAALAAARARTRRRRRRPTPPAPPLAPPSSPGTERRSCSSSRLQSTPLDAEAVQQLHFVRVHELVRHPCSREKLRGEGKIRNTAKKAESQDQARKRGAAHNGPRGVANNYNIFFFLFH